MSYANSQVLNLAINQLRAGVGPAIEVAQANRTFQAVITQVAGGPQPNSATVLIEVSNDGVNFITLKTLTCSAAATVSTAKDAAVEAWKYTRSNITALSAGSQANVYMGV